MKKKPNQPAEVYARPADKTLKAYKAWITTLCESLGVKDEPMSEKEWKDAWREFWGTEMTKRQKN